MERNFLKVSSQRLAVEGPAQSVQEARLAARMLSPKTTITLRVSSSGKAIEFSPLVWGMKFCGERYEEPHLTLLSARESTYCFREDAASPERTHLCRRRTGVLKGDRASPPNRREGAHVSLGCYGARCR